MSISSDILDSIQNGSLKPFCEDGFPLQHVVNINFWYDYVNNGNAKWDDLKPALSELVNSGVLVRAPNGWFNFA